MLAKNGQDVKDYCCNIVYYIINHTKIIKFKKLNNVYVGR